MMLKSEHSKNPFAIDGQTSPPIRSAFATLGCEIHDLARESVDALLGRAKEELAKDADLVTSYGRPVTLPDLESAALKLRDPESRLVHAFLDYPYFAFETGDVSEVEEILETYESRLREAPAPKLADTSLFAALYRMADVTAEPAAFEAPRAAAPALPKIAETLDRLA